jgi:DNA-binding MarR family transcriptional regulator
MSPNEKIAATEDQELYLDLWQQLLRCSKTFEHEIGSRFRKHFNQSLTRFELLSQLSDKDQSWLPIGKVAEQLIGSNGNITKLVERMVAEDLLNRRNVKNDRRISEISLSAKGKLLHFDMAFAHARWTQSLMDQRLPIADAEQLGILLGKANQDSK